MSVTLTRALRWSVLMISIAAVAAGTVPVAASPGGAQELPVGLGVSVGDPREVGANASDVDRVESHSSGPRWYEASEWAGPTQNCIHGYSEQLGMAWNGWYGEIGSSPTVGNVYYVKVGWGVSGNPCGGGAKVHVEIVPPAHTQLAISSTYRVRCFYKGPSASNLSEFTGDCPQSPQTGMYGGHAFDPPGNQGPWPTATGAMFEIWIPVKSSRQLNGSVPSSGPCDTCLYAGVWMIDGVNSPWVWPRIPVYVGGSSTTSGPYVTYPAPAITDVTYNPSDNAAYVKLWANLFTEGTSGKAYFQMGFKKGEYVAKSNPEITVPSGSWQMSEIWRMQPGKIYHWRACYEPTGGTRVCGPNKSFHAPPDTVITESKIRRSKRRATFSFTSPTSGMIFQCKLDDQKWKACTSPRAYGKLSKGTHVFRVRAVDPVGNKDTTPAKKAFRI